MAIAPDHQQEVLSDARVAQQELLELIDSVNFDEVDAVFVYRDVRKSRRDNGYAHRDRVRKRTAFKHGVMFRAARKVMR